MLNVEMVGSHAPREKVRFEDVSRSSLRSVNGLCIESNSKGSAEREFILQSSSRDYYFDLVSQSDESN